MNQSGPILPQDLPEKLRRLGAPGPLGTSLATGERPTLAEIERRYALQVLAESGGNKTRAAEVLGIDRKTLYRLLGEKEER